MYIIFLYLIYKINKKQGGNMLLSFFKYLFSCFTYVECGKIYDNSMVAYTKRNMINGTYGLYVRFYETKEELRRIGFKETEMYKAQQNPLNNEQNSEPIYFGYVHVKDFNSINELMEYVVKD